MTTRDGDGNGRRTTKAMQEHRAYYGYAYGDKMKSLTSDFPDEVASLESVYDGLGKLRRVTDPAGATWYRSNTFAFEGIYGEGASEWDIGELGLALVNQPGQQAGPPLALRLPGDPDPFYIHYFLDNIQSARRLRLDDRTEMGASEYTPYGEFYHTSGLDGLYKFAGHIHDNATAMYWAPYRWYDPQVARWTTRDPLGMVDGPNVYAYSRSNPIAHSDPLGLKTKDECVAEWEQCYDNCSTYYKTKMEQALCYVGCAEELALCMATAAAEWACENPGTCVVGATVIVGGVIFIVVSGGSGGCVLVPLFA